MTARCVVTAALLTGGCAARGVGVRARESLATGVDASFRHRCFPTLARAKPAGRARCGFLDPYGAAMSLDTRLGSWGGATWHGGVAESARQVSIETAAKLPAIPRRGSGGYPSEGHMRIELDRIWTEFWRGRSREIEGDRRRSKEVEGDGRRSVESYPTSPIFARLVRPPEFSTQFGRS